MSFYIYSHTAGINLVLLSSNTTAESDYHKINAAIFSSICNYGLMLDIARVLKPFIIHSRNKKQMILISLSLHTQLNG